MIRSLEEKGVQRAPDIRRALARVDRRRFVPEEYAASAYQDIPLPIGDGQTISQPYTVVFMLELLRPASGDRIMDIGSGSGWQSALLADIAGAEGRVYAFEIVPRLCALGRANAAVYPELAERITFYCRSAAHGLPSVASRAGGFDGIIAAAEVRLVPAAWRRQLKTGGRLVYPKEGALFLEVKRDDGSFSAREYPGFAFVPFVDGL